MTFSPFHMQILDEKSLEKEARVTFKDQNYLLFLFSFFLFLPFFNFFKLFFSVPAGKCL